MSREPSSLLGLPAGGLCFWLGSVASISRVSQAPHFHSSAPVVTLRLIVAGWGHGVFGFAFAASSPRSVLPRPCRVLVLLNPRGGKGKALQLFRSHVQPLLAQADVSFMLVLTGECLPEGVQGASSARRPPGPIATLLPLQSGRTTLGSWCRRRSWGAGMHWWSCPETA